MNRDAYEGFSFGDARLDRRFAWLREAAERMPGASFPVLSGSEPAREATYRFLNNPRVTLAGMIGPHIASSVDRLRQSPLALIVHDSSELKFTGDFPRPGLGRMPSGQGFLGHFALAVTADGQRAPLGVVGVSTLFRGAEQRVANRTRRSATDRESLRWRDLILEVEERAQHAALIHVMDREADSYELLHLMQQKGLRFVVRLNRERMVHGVDDDAWVTTEAQMSSTQTVITREIRLSRRTAKRPEGPRRTHPPREGREATICLGAQQIVVRRPLKAPAGHPQMLTVNVVRVWEPNPPPNQDPVEWLLLTSEPIDSVAALERVVDWYRARWVIEEFFKALKTGCNYEQRQLENRGALLNALGLFIPVAWQMIALRTEARRAEVMPSTVISTTQIEILRQLLPKKLPPQPTARAVYLAVAEIGGHIANNGEPGWLVLSRGLTRLRDYETIWRLARRKERCDQS